MKKDLFIKILKYLGVGLIGAFVGIGALAGVSSCYSLNTKKASADSVTENYAFKDTDFLSTYHDVNDYGSYFSTQGVAGLGIARFSCQAVLNNNVYSYIKMFINFSSYTRPNHTTGFRCTLWGFGFSNTFEQTADNSDIFFAYEGRLYDVYNYYDKPFYLSNVTYIDNVTTPEIVGNNNGRDIVYYWINNVDTADIPAVGSFTFNQQINYYAPYYSNIDTYFVNDASMDSAGQITYKTIFTGLFRSGGEVFTDIRLEYMNAVALSYLDNSNNRQVWGVNGFASYTYMFYYNSNTNRLVAVNSRNTYAWSNGSTSGVDTLKGSTWVSANYSYIEFLTAPTDLQITEISKLNNATDVYNHINSVDNVGLSNAFTLLGQAFTAWLPIFNVTIVPGITLGLLIFLPLIVGIIILVIWVVKR